MFAARHRHPVIVLAHGSGSRLATVASGTHKTIEEVFGRPVLWWLLREVEATGMTGPTIISLRQEDPAVRAVAATCAPGAEIRFRLPTGYLPDVYAYSREYGPRFTVIEADTVTHPGSLRNFLLLAERIGADADLCVGVGPATANPNGPAVVVDDRGLVATMTWTGPPTGVVPLAAWHWTSQLLDDAAEFSKRSTSTADYIAWAVPHGARVVPIGIPAGFNINTPADLNAARGGIARWFGYPASVSTPPVSTRQGDQRPWGSLSSPAQPA